MLDRFSFVERYHRPYQVENSKKKSCYFSLIIADSKITFADEPAELWTASENIFYETLRNLASQGKRIFMGTHDIGWLQN